jgi:amino acid transporter
MLTVNDLNWLNPGDDCIIGILFIVEIFIVLLKQQFAHWSSTSLSTTMACVPDCMVSSLLFLCSCDRCWGERMRNRNDASTSKVLGIVNMCSFPWSSCTFPLHSTSPLQDPFWFCDALNLHINLCDLSFKVWSSVRYEVWNQSQLLSGNSQCWRWLLQETHWSMILLAWLSKGGWWGKVQAWVSICCVGSSTWLWNDKKLMKLLG